MNIQLQCTCWEKVSVLVYSQKKTELKIIHTRWVFWEYSFNRAGECYHCLCSKAASSNKFQKSISTIENQQKSSCQFRVFTIAMHFCHQLCSRYSPGIICLLHFSSIQIFINLAFSWKFFLNFFFQTILVFTKFSRQHFFGWIYWSSLIIKSLRQPSWQFFGSSWNLHLVIFQSITYCKVFHQFPRWM